LRAEAIFAYVTNGAAASNNPLFSNSASKIGATNVYNQLAQGNVAATLSNLKNYKIELTQERNILASEVGRAAQSHPGRGEVIPLRGRLSGVAQPRTGSGEGQYRHLHRPIPGGRVGEGRDVLQRTKSRRRHHESPTRLARETSRSTRP